MLVALWLTSMMYCLAQIGVKVQRIGAAETTLSGETLLRDHSGGSILQNQCNLTRVTLSTAVPCEINVVQSKHEQPASAGICEEFAIYESLNEGLLRGESFEVAQAEVDYFFAEFARSDLRSIGAADS